MERETVGLLARKHNVQNLRVLIFENLYDRLFGVATDCHFYYLTTCVFTGVAILVIRYVVCA